MELPEVAVQRLHRIACHIDAAPRPPCDSSLTSMVCSAGKGVYLGRRKDSRLFFARPGSSSQAFYMRESMESQVVFSQQEECSPPQQVFDSSVNASVSRFVPKREDDPLFGKPVLNCTKVQESGGSPVDNGPLFARRANEIENGQVSEHTGKNRQSVNQDQLKCGQACIKTGPEWIPRMDIVESRMAHVVTVELPGVNSDGIRVEVNTDRLIVTGTRSTDWWSDQEALYHRRELLHGPYKVVWQIPKNSDVDAITAEFVDGFLRIMVPKF